MALESVGQHGIRERETTDEPGGGVIATTTGGLAETVTGPLTSYADQPGRTPSPAAAIRRALSADPPSIPGCSPMGSA